MRFENSPELLRDTNLPAYKAVKIPFMDRYIVSGVELRQDEQDKKNDKAMANKEIARLLYQNAMLRGRLTVTLGSKPKRQVQRKSTTKDMKSTK